MKRRILGFQRRVWWPKWTPASSSSRMPTCVAMWLLGSMGAVPVCTARTRRDRRAGPATASQTGSKGRLQHASLEDVTEMHPLADRGFADAADRYDRGRPGYPEAVV